MKAIFTILFFLLFVELYSQQETSFNLKFNNYSLFNPACTGINTKNYASLNSQNQLSYNFPNFKNIISIERKFDSINSGLGIILYSNTINNYSKIRKISINYSYHIKLKKDNDLSIGANFGIYNNKYDYRNNYSHEFKGSESNLVANFGISYKSRRLLLGISTTNLTLYEFQNSRVWFLKSNILIGKYNIHLNKTLQLEPNLIITNHEIFDKQRFNSELLLLLKYKSRIWAGFTLNHSSFYESFVTLVGGIDILGKYRLGLSFQKYYSYRTNLYN